MWQKIARRIRVPLGFVFAGVFLWLARPTWQTMLASLLLVVPGVWLRAYAAGYVRKNAELTRTGPYAYTRNPLYLGSMMIAFGFAAAAGSWVILIVLAAVGIGLLISSVVANMQQAMLFSFVVLMPFTLLSGLTTPIENMPAVLQYFTLINPLRYAIDIIHRIYLEAAGLGSLVPELWPLAIISAVTLLAASWMFRNRLG